MIVISFFKENGRTVRVSASGHSGLAESGSDVLCAAVSALVQTAYLASADISDGVTYRRDSGKGEFEFSVGREHGHDIDVILRALEVGLADLQSGYPQNIKIEEKTLCL